MTKCRMLTWGLWALLVMAMMNIAACSNGPTTPNPSDVKDYSGGDTKDKDLFGFLGAKETLREAGGGARIVDAGGYTLICVFDRWQHSDLTARVSILDANGHTTPSMVNGAGIYKDLVFPITVMAMVEGYTSQAIVKTHANLIAFGMQRIGYASYMMYGIGDKTILTDNNAIAWCTLGMSTQGDLEATKYTGVSDRPICLMPTNPFRPAGAVTFLYIINELTPPYDNGSNSSVFPHLSDLPLDQWTCVGYAYDSLGTLPFSTGGWLIGFQDVSTVKTYTDGTYTISAQLPGTIVGGGGPTIHFAGGTCLADTWEFVPSTIPATIIADSDSGTYTLDGVTPIASGERTAVRGAITYMGGGTEIRYEAWDPAGDTVPAVDFGVLPQVTAASVSTGGPYLSAEWTNDPAVGLLALDYCSGDTVLYRAILASDEDGLPENAVSLLPLPKGTYPLDVKLTRISCAGTSIDDWDQVALWSTATSFAQSAAKKFIMTTVVTP